MFRGSNNNFKNVMEDDKENTLEDEKEEIYDSSYEIKEWDEIEMDNNILI